MSSIDNIIENIPSFPSETISQKDWKDGLIVRMPNWLGDAVMAVPALLQLRKVIPENCGLFVLSPPELSDLFDSLSFIDVVVALHKKHSNWSREDKLKIKKLKPGIALLFNNSLRDALHFKLIGIRKIYGAAARGRSFLLTNSFSFPKIKNKQLNKLHHTARYLAMAYALGAPKWNAELPEFSLCPHSEIMHDDLNNAIKTSNLLILAPGAAYGDAKKWPVENFRSVLEYWLENDGSVAVVGTSSEQDAATQLLLNINSDKVYNLAGKTTLKELLLLLSNASFCVANDSGTMHLGALLGIRGTAVFGSTDPTSTSPVSVNWNILYTKEDCSPCFKRVCPLKSYKCLKNITPEMVIELFSEKIK